MRNFTVEFDETNAAFLKVFELLESLGAIVKRDKGVQEYVPTEYEKECIEKGRKEHFEGNCAFSGSVENLRKALAL